MHEAPAKAGLGKTRCTQLYPHFWANNVGDTDTLANILTSLGGAQNLLGMRPTQSL